MKGFAYIRKLYGVSLDDVAQFVGVTNQSVSAWEQKGIVPEKRLDKLAEYFDIPKHFFNMELNDAIEEQIRSIKFVNDAKHMGFIEYGGQFQHENVISDLDFNDLIASIQKYRKYESQYNLIKRFVKILDNNSVSFLQHILTAIESTEKGRPPEGADDFLETLFRVMVIWKQMRTQERVEYQDVLKDIPEAEELF